MNRIFSFLFGLVFGAVVGASIAILLAPYSGQDLQKELRSRAQTIRDDVQRAASERRAELEAQLAHLRAS
jgi:gas vesicle protein